MKSRDRADSGAPHYVAASGDLHRGTVGSFARALSRAAGVAEGSLYVDLYDVEFIDSAGYVAILNADRKMRQRGGDVVVLCERPNTRRVFTLLDPHGRLRVCP